MRNWEIHYKGYSLKQTEKKEAGKNRGTFDGFYRNLHSGQEYFVKKPEDSRELFTELFAGLLLQKFKAQGLIEPAYHDSLICADFTMLPDGFYALVQPKINFKELHILLGTSNKSGKDRSSPWEFLFPNKYKNLAQISAYGLSTALMYSLFLGDNSVHSGNVVVINHGSASAPVHQFARIDWGAAFRNFGHPDNNEDILKTQELKKSRIAGVYKDYFARYRDIPNLFPAIADKAQILWDKLTTSDLIEMISSVLDSMPADLINNEGKENLSKYLGIDAFKTVRFGDRSSYKDFAEAFAGILHERLAKITELKEQASPVAIRNNPLYNSIIPEIVISPDVETTPFPDLVSRWGDTLDASVNYNFASVDQIQLIENFNRFVDDIAARSNNYNWGHHSNHNILVDYASKPAIDYLSHGDAFVPYYRESTIIRRLYTRSTDNTTGAARFQPYEVPNDSYLTKNSEATWSMLGKMLTNGSGIVNALRILNSKDIASDPELSADARETFNLSIKAFLSDYHRLQLPEDATPPSESEFFYPISDKELHVLTGEQLLTIALQEMDAAQSGQLLARILVNDQTSERMNTAFEKYGKEISERKDNPADKMAQLREWREQFESAKDKAEGYRSLPEFLQNECVNYQERRFLNQLSCFQHDKNKQQLHLLVNAFEKLPTFIQSMYEDDYIKAGNELIQTFINTVCKCEATPDEKRTALASLDDMSNYPQFTTTLDDNAAKKYRVIKLIKESNASDDFFDVALSDKVLFNALAKRREPSSKGVIDDLLKLKAFYKQKRALNKDNKYGDSYNQSLRSFYAEAINIRLSDKNIQDQAENILASAHVAFKPRHSTRRLVADVLMMVGSLFAGLGLAVGISRKIRGTSFFFSQAQTSREKDLLNNWLVEKAQLTSSDDASIFKPTAPAA